MPCCTQKRLCKMAPNFPKYFTSNSIIYFKNAITKIATFSENNPFMHATMHHVRIQYESTQYNERFVTDVGGVGVKGKFP